MVMLNRLRDLTEAQEGFAPLIVTIVIITVLSLITLGFVELMRNNQYNGLNKQLNNDAYYAAESGVNDAIQAIQAGFSKSKTQCGPLTSSPAVPGSQYLSNNEVNGNQDVYSCLLINPAPATLQYSSVDTNSPTVAFMTGEDPNSGNVMHIGYLKFSWQAASSMGASPYSFASPSWLSCGNGPCLPQENSWSATNPVNGKLQSIVGILRLALTPMDNSTPNNGTIPTDTNSTYTTLLYPATGNGTPGNAPSYSGATIGVNSGEVVSGNCTNNNSSEPDDCNVIIDVKGAHTNTILMELRSIYAPTTVTVTAYDNGGTAPQDVLDIKNAQTLIDSTGSDHGVLKRIQVRVPTLNSQGMPAYDMVSKQSICKNLNVFPHNNATGNNGQAISASSSCGL